MSSIDQQFVEFIVKSLVGNPDAVKVDRRIDEKGVLLELTVDPEDLGRVIGKRGATAQSIRSLLRALGTKNDARYNLKIIDNGVGSNYGGPAPVSSHSDENDDANLVHGDDYAVSDDQVVPAHSSDFSSTDEDEIPAKASHSNVVSKTRKELEELDDLDV